MQSIPCCGPSSACRRKSHDILAGPELLAASANAPLRQQDLIQAWSDRPFDLVSDEEEAAATRVTGELLERIEALRSGSLEKRDRLDRPSSHLGTESERQPWYRQLREYLAAWGKGEPAEQLVRRMLQQSGGDVTAVMMQYEAGRSSGRTVTLLTALDGPLLLGAIKRVTQPDYWGRLRGDFAVWGTQPQSLGTAVIGGSYHGTSRALPDQHAPDPKQLAVGECRRARDQRHVGSARP